MRAKAIPTADVDRRERVRKTLFGLQERDRSGAILAIRFGTGLPMGVHLIRDNYAAHKTALIRPCPSTWCKSCG
jgi:hypothetical protein